MSSFSISGKVVWVGDLKLMGAKQFPTREFAIEFPTKYRAQTPKFKVVGEMATDFQYTEGDEVDVLFEVEGRSYEGKFFNDLRAWRVRQSQTGGRKPEKPAPGERAAQSEDDDVPF